MFSNFPSSQPVVFICKYFSKKIFKLRLGLTICWKTIFAFLYEKIITLIFLSKSWPVKGCSKNINSYNTTPTHHTSNLSFCYSCNIISGDQYNLVPIVVCLLILSPQKFEQPRSTIFTTPSLYIMFSSFISRWIM